MKLLSCLNCNLQVSICRFRTLFQQVIISIARVISPNSQSASSPDLLLSDPPLTNVSLQDSPSPESHFPVTPAPMNFQQQYQGLHAATNIGRGRYRSFLDIVFDATLAYGAIRRSILQGLTTVDSDNMRQTCRSIDHCLMQSTNTDPPSLQYPPHTIDKCEDIGLPVPPSLGLRGSCPNPPQCSVRIRPCQYHDFQEIRFWHPHGNRELLVCEVCRRNWHDNIGTNPGTAVLNLHSRYVWWRVAIASGHVTVCKLCDREHKNQHYPEGHDGCDCYREYYKKRWLCRRCDVRNGDNIAGNIAGFARGLNRRNLRQVGNRMVSRPVMRGPVGRWLRSIPPGQFPCPCGREVSENQPPAIQAAAIPNPWTGNHNLITSVGMIPGTQQPQFTTKQCVKCCKYIIPPDRRPTVRQPTRRSARVADRRSGMQGARKHTMLDRTGKAALRYGVNSKGFEVTRAEGGWAR